MYFIIKINANEVYMYFFFVIFIYKYIRYEKELKLN